VSADAPDGFDAPDGLDVPLALSYLDHLDVPVVGAGEPLDDHTASFDLELPELGGDILDGAFDDEL
jgi:hypothetical protein